MSSLCTGQIVKQPKLLFVKYLTQFVCLIHSSMTKRTPNQQGDLANT